MEDVAHRDALVHLAAGEAHVDELRVGEHALCVGLQFFRRRDVVPGVPSDAEAFALALVGGEAAAEMRHEVRARNVAWRRNVAQRRTRPFS